MHIVVDILGLPHAIHVTCANVTDHQGAIDMVSSHHDQLFSVVNFLVYGGYSGKNFADTIKALNNASVEVVKRNDPHKFKVLPKLWIVERTFAWLEKCRRLWKNCERKLNTSLNMTILAFIALLLRRY